jgi:hypothetical protein
VIVYSPGGDVYLPVYRHKAQGFAIPVTVDTYEDLTTIADDALAEALAKKAADDAQQAKIREIVEALRADYTWEPRLPLAAALDIVRTIFERIPDGARFFFILPYEWVKWDEALEPRPEAVEYNPAIREIAQHYPAVILLPMNELVGGAHEMQRVRPDRLLSALSADHASDRHQPALADRRIRGLPRNDCPLKRAPSSCGGTALRSSRRWRATALGRTGAPIRRRTNPRISTPPGRLPSRNSGHETAFTIEDVNRLEAVIVVVGVEQAQLASVHLVKRVVDVEHDAGRRAACWHRCCLRTRQRSSACETG